MNHARLPLSAIVFDFDGTLAKLNIDFPRMRKTVLGLMKSFGIYPDNPENLFVLEMIAEGKRMIARHSPEKESDFVLQANDLIEYIEMEAAENGKLIDGTIEMLHELKRRGIKTGVVTRNCEAAINHVFPDIHSYFDSVMTRDHTLLVKPNPEHLRLSLQELRTAPKCASMVGDHPMDIKIGREVGVLTIGVLTGASSRDDLIQAEADLVLEKAADLIEIIL